MGPSRNDKKSSGNKKRARFAEEDSVEEKVDVVITDPRKSARMDSFRETAERRAAHFARAESSTVSTTPTGRFRAAAETVILEDGNERQSWPGPFSTARSILAKREAAKKERDERIANEKNQANMIFMDDDYFAPIIDSDMYDEALSKVTWKPNPSGVNPHQQALAVIPSLVKLTLLTLAKHFKSYEDLSMVPSDLLDRLADEIGKRRELDLEACQHLAIPHFTSLYLSDCGAVDEDMLIRSIEAVCGVQTKEGKDHELIFTHDDANNAQHPLTRLILRSCGRCFTDRVAGAVCNHIHHLESLVLTGCYQLTDSGLINILLACQQTLLELNLTCNNRLSDTGLKAIFSLQSLQSLSLDHISQLNDDHFSRLFASFDSASNDQLMLPNLQELSLLGLAEVSDKSFVALIEQVGGVTLTSLSLSSYKLSDDTIIAIREHCHQLTSLTIIGCTEVSTAAWLGLFVTESETETAAPADHEGGIGALTKVNLKGCIHVTDDVIIELCKQYGKNINSLCINGCNRLTGRALAAIWIHMRKTLSYLDISFVRGFQEGALAYLIEVCQKLEEVHVWGCTQVTKALLSGHEGNNLKIVGAFHQLVATGGGSVGK